MIIDYFVRGAAIGAWIVGLIAALGAMAMVMAAFVGLVILIYNWTDDPQDSKKGQEKHERKDQQA